MPIASPQDTTQMILRALEQAGQRAILHAGWGSLGMTSLPDCVYTMEYAPYDWLFQRMAALVHHGDRVQLPQGYVAVSQHWWYHFCLTSNFGVSGSPI